MSSKYLIEHIKERYREDISARIQRGLRDQQYSQEDLAHLSGVNRRTITNLVNASGNPTIETLARIQAILHIELLR